MRRPERLFRWLIPLAFITCASRPPMPVAIPLDHVSCARCGMMISEARGTAQAVFAGHEPRYYDDIGCMAADRTQWRDGHPFVSLEGGDWMAAELAWYAQPAGVRTPMGYNNLAYASADAARAHDAHGRARNWDALLATNGGGPR